MAALVSLACFMGLVSCAGSSSPKINDTVVSDDPRLVEARALEDAGNKEAARRAFRKHREAEPSRAAAWLGEARNTTAHEQRQELSSALVERAGSATDEEERLDFLAISASLIDDLEDRENRLGALAREQPNNPYVHAFLAALYASRADDERAFSQWQAAAASPRAPDFALSELSEALIARRDFRRALDVLLRLEGRGFEDFRTSYNLGTLFLESRNDPKEAFERFERAHRLRPLDLDAALNYASSALLIGRDDLGFSILSDALGRHPDEPAVHFNLGVYYADHADDPTRAIASFRRYLELGGDQTMRVERWIGELESERDGK